MRGGEEPPRLRWQSARSELTDTSAARLNTTPVPQQHTAPVPSRPRCRGLPAEWGSGRNARPRHRLYCGVVFSPPRLPPYIASFAAATTAALSLPPAPIKHAPSVAQRVVSWHVPCGHRVVGRQGGRGEANRHPLDAHSRLPSHSSSSAQSMEMGGLTKVLRRLQEGAALLERPAAAGLLRIKVAHGLLQVGRMHQHLRAMHWGGRSRARRGEPAWADCSGTGQQGAQHRDVSIYGPATTQTTQPPTSQSSTSTARVQGGREGRGGLTHKVHCPSSPSMRRARAVARLAGAP